jgi:hypothetical protein
MQTIRIYVHRAGQVEPNAVDAATNAPLGELLGEADGAIVLREDEEDELDLGRPVASSGLRDRDHVHVGKRAKITVEVAFNGESIEDTFPASARVDRIFRWATGKHGFDLDKADAAEHTLALCGTDTVPPGDAHIGSLDDATPGRVCFSLIPKQRFEG